MRLAEAALADSACYLVDVVIGADNAIVVEIDHDEAVSIDDCVALSQYIEQHLDRDAEDYELEVTSAGLDRPFKIVRQYRKPAKAPSARACSRMLTRRASRSP